MPRPKPKLTLEERVVRSAGGVLEDQQHVSAIDVLMRMGLLAPSNVDAQRLGRLAFLEEMIQGSPEKVGQSLEIFRRCAWPARGSAIWSFCRPTTLRSPAAPPSTVRPGAVVVESSRSRKRYERQGILVAPAAIQQAGQECAEDAPQRALERERAAVARKKEDAVFVVELGANIHALFPRCPASEVREIAEHTAKRGRR